MVLGDGTLKLRGLLFLKNGTRAHIGPSSLP